MLRRKNSQWRRTLFTCAALTMGAGILLTSENLAADVPAEVITAAITDASRPSTDTVRDINRKPAEVLQFAGLKTGDKIADYAAGAGYFTRLFAAVVGPNGHVYASVPSALFKYLNIVKGIAEIETYAFTHANVTVSLAAALDAAKYPEKLDVFWISQNYHDLHDRFMGPVDMGAFNRAVFAALKPGGTYLVLDHVAGGGGAARRPPNPPRQLGPPRGAGGGRADVTDTLHRIEPATVRREVESAGFKFVGESAILANAADPHTAGVFDPSIQGHTDQFILKFRRPRS